MIQKTENRQMVIETLCNLITNSVPEIRAKAVEALGQIGDSLVKHEADRSIEPHLLKALQDHSAIVRQNAATALGMIGSPNTVTNLIAAIKDPEPGVRESIINALGNFDHEKILDIGLKTLTDPNPQVRAGAARLLGKFHSPITIPHLVNALSDPDPAVGENVAIALSQIPISSETILDKLLQLLQTPNPDSTTHQNAAIALGYLRREEGIPALLKLLEDSDYRVKEIAIDALSKIGSPQLSAA